MATKNTKSVGKKPSVDYLEQAAKLCIYPVDIPGKFISIPQDELHTDDLMVSHLVNQYGFKIQSAIPGTITKKEIFNPAIDKDKPLFKDWTVKEPEVETKYKLGDQFEIVSTSCQTKITHIEKGKIHFIYTNRTKPPLLAGEQQLDRVLKMGLWVKIII